MDDVTLRDVTPDNLSAVLGLEVSPAQAGFVASNAKSIAEAHFEPKAWFRAIYAGDEPVGFVMLYDDPDGPQYFLWRLMIAHEHQGKGYGRRALELLVEYVRTRPHAAELLVSYHEGDGEPSGFYRTFGFQDTGQRLEGEVVLRLPLPDVSALADGSGALPTAD